MKTTSSSTTTDWSDAPPDATHFAGAGTNPKYPLWNALWFKKVGNQWFHSPAHRTPSWLEMRSVSSLESIQSPGYLVPRPVSKGLEWEEYSRTIHPDTAWTWDDAPKDATHFGLAGSHPKCPSWDNLFYKKIDNQWWYCHAGSTMWCRDIPRNSMIEISGYLVPRPVEPSAPESEAPAASTSNLLDLNW